MKNHPPPPWLEDYLQKSNQLSSRSTQLQEELIYRIVNYENRMKSFEKIMTKQDQEIEQLTIQVSMLKKTVEQQTS